MELVPADYVRWITALGLGPGTRLSRSGRPIRCTSPIARLPTSGRPNPSAATALPAGPRPLGPALPALQAGGRTVPPRFRLPIDDMVRALNEYQPDIMVMPPSAATRLADEQAAGRLTIRPRTILSSAEVLTDAARARFRAAWGADLYDTYVMTETGLIGAECPQRGGIHISEDLVIIESVDERHQPVPHGTAGAKVLVTNLTNYAQPLIRYEVPDRITLSPDICRCGRPFATIAPSIRAPSRGGDRRDKAARPPLHRCARRPSHRRADDRRWAICRRCSVMWGVRRSDW